MFSDDIVESLNTSSRTISCGLRLGEEGKALQQKATRASLHKRYNVSSSPRKCLNGNVQMLISFVSSCCMSSSNQLDRNVFGHVHVCHTPDAERVQILCKWCATCASWLLHCATARCTLSSDLSFRSGCAWATMDPQLQQHCVIGSRSAGKLTPRGLSRICSKAPPSPPRGGVIGKS